MVMKTCPFKATQEHKIKSVFCSNVGTLFCLTVLQISGFCVHAKDCGTFGMIYSIEEEDPIQTIQTKLKNLEDSGELDQRNKDLQQKTKASIERPAPVKNISNATETRVFYYDPAYIVPHNLRNHKGHLFAKEGTVLNPLDTVSLTNSLVFFDGDDLEQVVWAQTHIQTNRAKFILVKGSPIELSHTLKVPVYFDQGGFLTQKLGIKHVPAVVTQAKSQLRIKEISIGDEK